MVAAASPAFLNRMTPIRAMMRDYDIACRIFSTSDRLTMNQRYARRREGAVHERYLVCLSCSHWSYSGLARLSMERGVCEDNKRTSKRGANCELAIKYISVAIHVIMDDSTMIRAAHDTLDDLI
jgi:hypothetical protein